MEKKKIYNQPVFRGGGGAMGNELTARESPVIDTAVIRGTDAGRAPKIVQNERCARPVGSVSPRASVHSHVRAACSPAAITGTRVNADDCTCSAADPGDIDDPCSKIITLT